METSAHFGVYGLILRDGSVLLVRKTRGPYADLLDLPGGAPDQDDPDQRATLAREIAEETGLILEGAGPWHDFQFSLTQDSKGRKIDFLHSGVWTMARTAVPSLQPPCKTVASPDTDGSVWVTLAGWRKRTDLSILVRVVLSAAEERGLLSASSMRQSGVALTTRR